MHNIRKSIYGIGVGLMTLLSFSSCNKYLDVNSSPNSVTDITADKLFVYAEVNYGSNRSGGDFYLPLALAAQTQADGGAFGWDAGNAYQVSTYSTGNLWSAIYTRGNNLKIAIDKAQSGIPVNNAAAAQCKILLAQMLYDGTMLFGDVPYKEAFQPQAFPYPHFDTQKDVLDSLINLLDQAITQIPATNVQAIKDGDLFYTGDLTKWKKAATFMKLRIMMAMVNKDPSKATLIGQLAASSNLLGSAADNMKFPYGTTKGNQNPKFELLDNYGLYLDDGRNSQFFAHRAILDPMNANNDPRIPFYFEKAASATQYVGLDGGVLADESYATISTKLFAEDAPELIVSYQEQLFILAEIYARGLGVTIDLTKANTYYQQALIEACVYYGVNRGDATTWASQRDLTKMSNPVDEIHLQQFIDFMDRPSDAFTNWRRSGTTDATKVPNLTIPIGSPSGYLFHRWPYPVNAEIAANPNAPTNSPQYFNKLWFEQ